MKIELNDENVLTLCTVLFEPVVMAFPESGESERVPYDPKVRPIYVNAVTVEEAMGKVRTKYLGEIEGTDLVIDSIIFHDVKMSQIHFDC